MYKKIDGVYCPTCGSCFSNKITMNIHKNDAHRTTEGKVVKGYKYPIKKTLSDHPKTMK